MHLVGDFTGCADLDQFSLADAGAELTSLLPCLGAFDEFGPKREQAALSRFDGVNGAAAVLQKMTLGVERLAEADDATEANYVAFFELGLLKVQVSGGPFYVLFREIDEAFYLATARASLLAGKTQGPHAYQHFTGSNQNVR